MGATVARPQEGKSPVVEWASAGRALEGGESGDLHVVVTFPDGALAAVIDGLGHGPEAAVAARAAAPVFEARPAHPVTALVLAAHEALRKTRGAVMSLAAFDARTGTMTWTGVGNVEGVLLRASRPATSGPTARSEGLTSRGGVVGYQLPPLRSSSLRVARGDTLILATDGISSAYSSTSSASPAAGSPREIADGILARHAKKTDDALVLVVRYLGGAP
jgi:serine/threonine protein phosphatase PrpC